jgi:hypothetical protein
MPAQGHTTQQLRAALVRAHLPVVARSDWTSAGLRITTVHAPSRAWQVTWSTPAGQPATPVSDPERRARLDAAAAALSAAGWQVTPFPDQGPRRGLTVHPPAAAP